MENIVNMVLGTTILILLILLARWLFWKRCNPNILYFLWIFVAFRILLPINIPFVWHNTHLNEEFVRNTPIYSYVTRENTEAVPKGNEVSNDSMLSDDAGDDNKLDADIGQSTDKRKAPKLKASLPAKTIFIIIWCIGSMILTFYFVLVNFYTFHHIKKRKVGELNHKIEIYEVAGHNCLVGIFHPQIFIAPQILKNPLYKQYVLLHEMEHYKIKDNFWLLIRTLCLIVQWFNPLVWIAYFKAQEDCELACDYRVLSCLNGSEKESYAETLLYILELDQKKVYFATSVVKRNKSMKKRMKCIFEKRKTKLFLILLFFMGMATATSFVKVKIHGEETDNTTVEGSLPDKKAAAREDDAENAEQTDIVFVENMKDIAGGKDLNNAGCYTTDITRGGNHFWIDENQTLWGTGSSEYGQLGELKEDVSIVTEPQKIADNVKHVDFSGEYFVIFLTEDNKLYGLGGNPAGVLRESGKDNFNSAYMNVVTEPVLIMEHVAFAKCGYSTIIALSEDGDVYVMGNNGYSAFSNEQYYTPKKVMEDARYVTSYFHTYAVICNDNSLWTWGDNRLGQCGIGSFSANVESPQKVMDDVDCAWMGKVAFNGGNAITEQDNLVVLKKDGNYYGCGEGIGTNLIYRTDDFDEAHLDDMVKVEASGDFQMITLQEVENVSLNSWAQKTKLVTEDMELRELTEEELERITKLQQDLLKGLSDEEITEIKEKLAGVHGGLEGDIVYYDFGTLTDLDSLRWEWFNDTIPEDNVDNGHWGPEVIQDLEEVKAKLSDDKVINLITEAQDEIQKIMNEHSNEHVMKAHMILHDVDYWLFRYPVADLKVAPADWNGIYIYYGELDGLLEEE
ncbi:MAG: hypothetical protein NC124_16290 [Clostridium sp.]|nr:hypothetical protein [Clostridium sp.]